MEKEVAMREQLVEEEIAMLGSHDERGGGDEELSTMRWLMSMLNSESHHGFYFHVYTFIYSTCHAYAYFGSRTGRIASIHCRTLR